MLRPTHSTSLQATAVTAPPPQTSPLPQVCKLRGIKKSEEMLPFLCSLNSLAFAGPCDPTNVVAQVQCGSGAVNVSWQASAGAIAYTVQAYIQSQTVPTASCVSSSTSCTLSQLQCGTMYNVSVLASDGTCNSSPLVGTAFKTGM